IEVGEVLRGGRQEDRGRRGVAVDGGARRGMAIRPPRGDGLRRRRDRPSARQPWPIVLWQRGEILAPGFIYRRGVAGPAEEELLDKALVDAEVTAHLE